MGKNKAISAAQEIAEIDPYIKVTCFAVGHSIPPSLWAKEQAYLYRIVS